MKNISIYLNVLCLALIGILFYQISKPGASTKNQSNADGVKVVSDIKDLPAAGNIAFINVDSLNAKYLLFKDKTKSITAEDKRLKGLGESLMKKYQDDVMAYKQAEQAGLRTPQEMEQMAQSIMAQERELTKLQSDSQQNLEMTFEQSTEEARVKILAYIKNYAVGKKYDYVLAYTSMMNVVYYANANNDITKDIVEGLNAEYTASKKK